MKEATFKILNTIWFHLCFISFKKSKTIGTKNRPVVTRGSGWVGGLTTKGKHKGNVRENIVCDHGSNDMTINLSKFTKLYSEKIINFTTYTLKILKSWSGYINIRK